MASFPIASRLAVRRTPRQAGNVMMEFALVAVAAIPLIFGMIAMGLMLGRGIQATQVTRDVGNMYSRGVDFTSAGTMNIVSKLAEDFDLDPSTGSAVLMFSRITKVTLADCAAAGLLSCPNNGQSVITQRLVIGNASLRQSNFVTPSPALLVVPTGNIAAADYLQDPSLVATGFSALLNQNPGDTAWMVEGFFQQPNLNFLLPMMGATSQGTYIHGIF